MRQTKITEKLFFLKPVEQRTESTGLTENTGQENDGQIAGVENAGLENGGQNWEHIKNEMRNTCICTAPRERKAKFGLYYLY